MKSKKLMMMALALTLAACGPQAGPTLAPDQIQASVVAMAFTYVAQTEAALPPVSTETDTALASATASPTLTETPISSVVEVSPTPSKDPCNGPFFGQPVAAPDAGKVDNGANIFITNTVKASVTVSLYLSKNQYGQCGYVSYVLPPRQSVTIMNVLPYGCYYASAYVNDPKKPSRASGGPACITGPDRTTFTVFADWIKITGP